MTTNHSTPDPERNNRIVSAAIKKMFPEQRITTTQSLMLKVKEIVILVKRRGDLLLNAKRLSPPIPPVELDVFRDFIVDQFCSEFNKLSKDELVFLCSMMHMGPMTEGLDAIQFPTK